VRITERPIPGVGYGEVTSTFIRQTALRAALAAAREEATDQAQEPPC